MKEVRRLFGIRSLRSGRAACLSVALCLPLAAVFIWLITHIPPSENNQGTITSLQTVLIVTVCVVVITIIPVIIAYFILRRRASRLDELFLPLGFSGRSFMINGRQYFRNVAGREVTIWILKGPTLDIRISVPVTGTLRVFLKDSIPVQTAGLLKTSPYLSQVPGLEGLAFYPADTPWLEGLLNSFRAAGAIRTLMTVGADWAVFRQVELYSGQLCFHLYESQNVDSWPLDQQTVSRWITSMEDLADELQTAGLPRINQYSPGFSGQTSAMVNMSFLRPTFLIVFVFLFIGIILTILTLFLAFNY